MSEGRWSKRTLKLSVDDYYKITLKRSKQDIENLILMSRKDNVRFDDEARADLNIVNRDLESILDLHRDVKWDNVKGRIDKIDYDFVLAAFAEELASKNNSQRAPVAESKFLLTNPPGHSLVVILQKMMRKKDFEHLVVQPIADVREEYFEALKSNDYEDARKIKRSLNYQLVLIGFQWLWTAPVAFITRTVFGFGKGE